MKSMSQQLQSNTESVEAGLESGHDIQGNIQGSVSVSFNFKFTSAPASNSSPTTAIERAMVL